MRKLLWINGPFGAIAFWVLSGSLLYGAVRPEIQTTKFLTAIQKKDIKTIFDSSYYYQLELSQIRSSNPRTLWNKLTAEYYESVKKTFLEPQENNWNRRLFERAINSISPDPRENIGVLFSLLTPSTSWKISEFKKI